MKKILFFVFIALAGNLAQAQLSAIASQLNSPIGVTTDEWGNQWVAEQGTGLNDGQVSRITKSGKKQV